MGLTTTVQQFLPAFSFLPFGICTLKSPPVSDSDDFLKHVTNSLRAGSSVPALLRSAQSLAKEYEAHLHHPTPAMIPYPATALAAVREEKTALALDLGGSTLRIARVHFTVCQNPILRDVRSCEIDIQIRNLAGDEFVRWIIDQVEETWRDIAATSTDFDHMDARLSDAKVRCWDQEPVSDRIHDRMSDASNAPRSQSTIPVAVTWSFPLMQTDVDRAIIQDMGKGFRASEDLKGTDLQSVFAIEFEQRGLPLRVTAIVNDAVANLAADMYSFPSTEYAIIAGTGVNSSMPIARSLMSRRLANGQITQGINDSASKLSDVFVNMELSMFGKSAFEYSEWDRLLDSRQGKSGFQPLEQLCSGRYLGEILRLVLVDAFERQLVFVNSRPHNLCQPYRLDTRLVACFEADGTADLLSARKAFAAVFPGPRGELITLQDAQHILTVARLISNRAAAYLGASIVSMWLFNTHPQGTHAVTPDDKVPTVKRIAFTGSVLEKYPGFRKRCQDTITALMAELSGGSVELRLAFNPESSLVGAAAIAIQ